ncbi:hypothetical protein L834_2295 [Mycobacteroides abscessus MAB_091912_2455]|nr:hypothetical protein L834_2295 [Mycobacteroides abscessus MAB_091912_2455]
MFLVGAQRRVVDRRTDGAGHREHRNGCQAAHQPGRGVHSIAAPDEWVLAK